MSDDLIRSLEDEIGADRSDRSLRARIRVLTEQRDAAVSRARAAEAERDALMAVCERNGIGWAARAALAEPVEPQPSAHTPLPVADGATTCTECGLPWPCPSCTPPDPESETP